MAMKSKPTMIFVKPKVAGTRVRNPDRKYRVLPPEGEHVPETIYWFRRLRMGDVVLAEPPEAVAAAAPPPEPAPPADPAKATKVAG